MAAPPEPRQKSHSHAYEVTVRVMLDEEGRVDVTCSTLSGQEGSSEHLPIQGTDSMATTETMALLECPMCDFTVHPSDDYVLQLHFEQVHTTDSPFVVKDGQQSPPPSLPPSPVSKRKHGADTPSSDDEDDTVACPEPNCGEVVLLSDFNEHLDYHASETLSFDESTGTYHSHHSSATMQGIVAAQQPNTGSSKQAFLEHNFSTDLPAALRRREKHERKLKKPSNRERSNTTGSEKSTLSRSILTFNPFVKNDRTVKPPHKTARLGKSELGPHAWEDRMPKWLHDQLEAGPKITVINRIGRDGRLIKQEQVQNETPGLMPILAQLSALDRTVKEAYFCHPSTLHIGKTPREGGFCGYRNIQMLLSYIQGAKAQGHEEFPGRTPGVLKLQDLIERAWDNGINTIGRIQTGGIRDTRKYIGTPEAQAFFLNSEINCAVEMFSDNKERGTQAHESLLAAVERYFAQAAINDGSNVHKTLLPPIYLQQPGHSITIVGFERRRDGSCNIIVFDPMYSTSPAMHKLIGRKNIGTARPEVLHAYRRGPKQLKRFAAFEILFLTATPPLFPAWDVFRQFPDCRFVYAFFRSRTLGYDVYPEDHFLSNFPWQQYGGLWSCDEARFARAESMNPLTAQALRLLTSEGASSRSSISTSPISPFTSSSFQFLPAANAHIKSDADVLLPSFFCSGKTPAPFLNSVPYTGSGPVLNMGSIHAALQRLDSLKADASQLTDVGRKYPGFPSPLSPSFSAKVFFPSPASETGSGAGTPRAKSPGACSSSPMSLDGSEMCGPSRRCESHGYEHYAAAHWDGIDRVLSSSSEPPRFPLRTPPRALSMASLSPPVSPPSVSPRASMIKSMASKQALRNLSHNPSLYPASGEPLQPDLLNMYSSPYHTPTRSLSPPGSPTLPTAPPPSIHIANGVETNPMSPLDPAGTMLLYTSNRAISSGLLGVRPLSEAQVAEYRFWRPCGARRCAFGCGAAQVGEWTASKRLFRDVPDVEEEKAEAGEKFSFGTDGTHDADTEVWEKGGCAWGEEERQACKSVWAGRRLVTDWGSFLNGCEREGVARF